MLELTEIQIRSNPLSTGSMNSEFLKCSVTWKPSGSLSTHQTPWHLRCSDAPYQPAVSSTAPQGLALKFGNHLDTAFATSKWLVGWWEMTGLTCCRVLNIYPQDDSRTLWLDALLLIFLTIKFTYFTKGVTIKNKSTVFLFLVDAAVQSRLTRCESEPLQNHQGYL